jgi:hypothetical protein
MGRVNARKRASSGKIILFFGVSPAPNPVSGVSRKPALAWPSAKSPDNAILVVYSRLALGLLLQSRVVLVDRTNDLGVTIKYALIEGAAGRRGSRYLKLRVSVLGRP